MLGSVLLHVLLPSVFDSHIVSRARKYCCNRVKKGDRNKGKDKSGSPLTPVLGSLAPDLFFFKGIFQSVFMDIDFAKRAINVPSFSLYCALRIVRWIFAGNSVGRCSMKTSLRPRIEI